MFKQLIRVLPYLLFLLILTSCVYLNNDSYSYNKYLSPQALLDKKIKRYSHLYQKITFLNLQSESDFPAIDMILGLEPKNLDYEHPVKLREDMVYVSVKRIWTMLKYKEPSATLFKADSPLGRQDRVCILTINPDVLASNAIQSTQHLLNLPYDVIKKIPYGMQLQPNDYLSFVIDHEIYHCLKSNYVGPQLISYKELWAGYNDFHNEQAADVYAVAMHIKTNLNYSSFAKNILRIRSMSIYNDDANHLTSKAIEQLLQMPAKNITKMSSHELFELANHIKNHLAISYDEYVQYLASVTQVMKELGLEADLSNELLYALQEVDVDPEQVKELVTSTKHSMADLCGGELGQGLCK